MLLRVSISGCFGNAFLRQLPDNIFVIFLCLLNNYSSSVISHVYLKGNFTFVTKYALY